MRGGQVEREERGQEVPSCPLGERGGKREVKAEKQRGSGERRGSKKGSERDKGRETFEGSSQREGEIS